MKTDPDDGMPYHHAWQRRPTRLGPDQVGMVDADLERVATGQRFRLQATVNVCRNLLDLLASAFR